MAAVPITIQGVIYPNAKGRAAGDQPFKATIVGYAWNPSLSIGGGPIEGQPPAGGPPGEPTHPIVPPGGYPHPEHPIANPPPVDPPVPPEIPPGDGDPATGFIKAPPASGGWGFHEDLGWVYYPGSGGGPKR
jgi:hypothetical protein